MSSSNKTDKTIELFKFVLLNMKKMPDVVWHKQGEVDYVFKYNGYILHVERMDHSRWWFGVSINGKEIASAWDYSHGRKGFVMATAKMVFYKHLIENNLS